MIIRVFWGGRELMAVPDSTYIDPLLALCQVLTLSCWWDPNAGLLFLDPPVAGKRVLLGGKSGDFPEVLDRIGSLLNSAGAKLVVGGGVRQNADLRLQIGRAHNGKATLRFPGLSREARRAVESLQEAFQLWGLPLTVKSRPWSGLLARDPEMEILVPDSADQGRFAEAIFAGAMRYFECLEKGPVAVPLMAPQSRPKPAQSLIESAVKAAEEPQQQPMPVPPEPAAQAPALAAPPAPAPPENPSVPAQSSASSPSRFRPAPPVSAPAVFQHGNVRFSGRYNPLSPPGAGETSIVFQRPDDAAAAQVPTPLSTATRQAVGQRLLQRTGPSAVSSFG